MRGFGQRCFSGIAWPLGILRVCAFLTIPASAALLSAARDAHRTNHAGAARLGRLHLDVLRVSSVLMVFTLLMIELISFSRIT